MASKIKNLIAKCYLARDINIICINHFSLKLRNSGPINTGCKLCAPLFEWFESNRMSFCPKSLIEYLISVIRKFKDHQIRIVWYRYFGMSYHDTILKNGKHFNTLDQCLTQVSWKLRRFSSVECSCTHAPSLNFTIFFSFSFATTLQPIIH